VHNTKDNSCVIERTEMESNTTLFNTSIDGLFNGTALELPLYITYMKMILFSVVVY